MLRRGVTVTDKNIPLLGYIGETRMSIGPQQKLFEEQSLSDKVI